MSEKEFLKIGRIVKAHGIKGELCIDYNADDLNMLSGFVFLSGGGTDNPAGLKKYPVRGLRMHKGRPLLTLEGVPDRTAAENLRGLAVLVPQNRLPELSPDEVYLSELPGLNIYLQRETDQEPVDGADLQASGPNGGPGSDSSCGQAATVRQSANGAPGKPLGILEAVDEVAGQEIWTIVTGEGKEVLLPANENFVREINLAGNYAVISPPPGLLDIYLK